MSVPFVSEMKCTAERSDLVLDGDDHGQMAALNERVPGVLQVGQRREGFLEAIPDLVRRLIIVPIGHPEASVRLVAHQATFARFVNSWSAWSWALRLRQAM